MRIVAQHHVGVGAVEPLIDQDQPHAVGDTFVDDRGGRLAGKHDDRLGTEFEQQLDERCDILARVGGV
ncbi:hypothetical protein D3C72_2076470 [compost metagenome]